MDRFDALQAFARVVESGSFTKAALTLHLSRTTVTQLVQQLEARLRVKLLHRTTRRVRVTPDGAAYYERVVRLLADLDDADASVSTAAAAPRGRLRVDVPSPLARLVLIPALPAFHAQYPDILLHMGVSDRPVDMVGDNVDCVLRGGPLSNPALVARHVGDLQLRVYAAPSYLQRAGARPSTRRRWKARTTAPWVFCGRAPASLCLSRCAVAPNTSAPRATMFALWTTATPTWPQAWRAWACSGCPTTWPAPTWRLASWCPCCRTGRWRRCRCTWPTRPKGM